MPEDRPFFSVIILAWMVQDYIVECLNSVRAQSCPDFEAIVVAPAGKDDTYALCRRFAEADERFVIVTCENRGQMLNRLAGLEKARGEYVLFLDGDDLWKPELLETMRSVCEQKHCDAVLFGAERFSRNGSVSRSREVFADNAEFSDEGMSEIYYQLIRGDTINAVWDKAIRRSVFSRVDVDWERYSDLRVYEDLLMNCFVLDRCESAAVLNSPLYRYRMREGSVMHRFSKNEVRDYYTVKEQVYGFMHRWKMADPQTEEMFFRRIAHYTADWIYRCAVSDLTYAEKCAAFRWLRNETMLYPKILPYMKREPQSLRHRLFTRLFGKSDFLLQTYAFPFAVLKRRKRETPSLFRNPD